MLVEKFENRMYVEEPFRIECLSKTSETRMFIENNDKIEESLKFII